MNRIRFILLFAIFMPFVSVTAQEKEQRNFLFEEYKDALIYYKDGRKFAAPVNFDLLAGHFLFIDAKDKMPKQFAFPEKVAFLQIDSRNFQFADGEAVEIIQMEPLFQVIYSGNTRQAPKKISHGGTTQTAAVDSYSGYSGNRSLSTQQQANNRVLKGINISYRIKIGKKTKPFNNENTFIKAFPKERRDFIKKYMETHVIDFTDVEQVYKLCQELIVAQ